MENNNSKHTLACMICGILTFCGVVASIISLVNGSKSWMARNIIDLMLSALIGYYAIYGYKKPHGNLLKYLILIFTAKHLLLVYGWAQMEGALVVVCYSIIIGLLCYVAGRLHRVKQNIVIISIVTVLLVTIIVYAFVNGIATIGAFTHLVIWLDICVAYFLRYKEHKEAGLMDAEKK